MTKKGVFRQLQAMTAKFITGDKWGYYPCCQAGRSDANTATSGVGFLTHIYRVLWTQKKKNVYFKTLPTPVYYFFPWWLTGCVTCGALQKLKIDGIMEAFGKVEFQVTRLLSLTLAVHSGFVTNQKFFCTYFKPWHFLIITSLMSSFFFNRDLLADS